MTANARGVRTLCGGVAALFLFAVFLVGGVGPTLQPAESAASASARTAVPHDDRTLLRAQSADQDAAAHRRYRAAGEDSPAAAEHPGPTAATVSGPPPRLAVRAASAGPPTPPDPAAPRVMRC
ncbi:hypothetical protein ACFV5N_18215 [Streptomyces sp. NPDC059853]|uniref:hypothetical protein n=1 Tax=Streptomyces sp. NPDC059853 TaxID=3346973 RepID=UPI00365E0E53